jgi:hypothetical protein
MSDNRIEDLEKKVKYIESKIISATDLYINQTKLFELFSAFTPIFKFHNIKFFEERLLAKSQMAHFIGAENFQS